MNLTSIDLELVYEAGANQTVGMRFTGVDVPKDAVVTTAWVQFTVDETDTGATNLVVRGEARTNSAAFTTSSGSISTSRSWFLVTTTTDVDEVEQTIETNQK